jgi:hypothetical protein
VAAVGGVNLDAIRERFEAFETAWDHEYMATDGPAKAAASAADVPALLEEIARLTADYAADLRQAGQEIRDLENELHLAIEARAS